MMRLLPLVVATALLATARGESADYLSGADRDAEAELRGLLPGTRTVEYINGRQYHVYTPSTLRAGERPALVLNIHGAGGSPRLQAFHSTFDLTAERLGFLVAYPAGSVGNTWNSGSCCPPASVVGTDDMPYLRAVVDRLIEERNVDPERVFSIGSSNGHMQSYRLACEDTARFPRIAGSVGYMALGNDCRPSQPISVLHFHGTEDGVIAYDLAVRNFQRLREINGCDPDEEPIVRDFGTSTFCHEFGCGGAANMTFCTTEGAPHPHWPGSPFAFPTSDIDANSQMAEFFGL